MTLRTLALLTLITTPTVAAADMSDFEKVTNAAEQEILSIAPSIAPYEGGVIITKREDTLIVAAIVHTFPEFEARLIMFVDNGVDGIVEKYHFAGDDETIDADNGAQQIFDEIITLTANEL